jgi:hypothetical protein
MTKSVHHVAVETDESFEVSQYYADYNAMMTPGGIEFEASEIQLRRGKSASGQTGFPSCFLQRIPEPIFVCENDQEQVKRVQGEFNAAVSSRVDG